jgi:hypothetical protein
MISIGAIRPWKLWVGIALGALLAADLGLGVFLWRGAVQDPRALRAERDRLAVQAKLLRADVERGAKIRSSLAKAGQDCDAFYRQSFLDSASGYSQIEADLAGIASHAGVKTSGFGFKRQEVKDRGVTEITITTGVEADYPGVFRFINGLERSKNFYLLKELRLESVATGGIKLNLELHTYFRT